MNFDKDACGFKIYFGYGIEFRKKFVIAIKINPVPDLDKSPQMNI